MSHRGPIQGPARAIRSLGAVSSRRSGHASETTTSERFFEALDQHLPSCQTAVIPSGDQVSADPRVIRAVEARNQLTVNLEVLVAVPPGVATLIFPVEAPDGTLTVSLVEASLVMVAALPLKVTDVVWHLGRHR
jgi:hypothetical protein